MKLEDEVYHPLLPIPSNHLKEDLKLFSRTESYGSSLACLSWLRSHRLRIPLQAQARSSSCPLKPPTFMVFKAYADVYFTIDPSSTRDKIRHPFHEHALETHPEFGGAPRTQIRLRSSLHFGDGDIVTLLSMEKEMHEKEYEMLKEEKERIEMELANDERDVLGLHIDMTYKWGK